MPSRLPRTWGLVTESWNDFLKHWDELMRAALWFIPAVILQAIPVFLPSDRAESILLIILSAIVSLVVTMIATAALYQAALAVDAGRPVSANPLLTAWPVTGSMLLIAILTGLAAIVASIPYFIALIVTIAYLTTQGGFAVLFAPIAIIVLLPLLAPAVYVSTRLGFSPLSFLSEGVKGRAALTHSWNITKRRFWPIFGRTTVAAILFVAAMLAFLLISMLIVQAVAGDRFSALMESDNNSPLANGVVNLVSGIIQTAIIPWFFLFVVKLYRAVEKTKV